ncbi:hypothetical protein L5515_001529 [Caenorhabditis briggsae]|uniref:Inner centromere protein ARK-binding domain-containing protein n=1 Tax=Caenorhabditis briggsae TaxID=6238 RepID=A0AAE9J3K0_CAEBR|nr:hypothetical protein L5515_001529 [Caenorhabditis briggsae]
MKRMMEVKNSELVFFQVYFSYDTLKIFSEFYEKADEIADNVTAKYKPLFDVKEVLQKYLNDIPRDLEPNLETKKAIKKVTMDLLETQVESLEDMEIAEASNRTEDLRGIKSETLTSSEDMEMEGSSNKIEDRRGIRSQTLAQSRRNINDNQLTTDGIKIDSERIQEVGNISSVIEIVEKNGIEESKPGAFTSTGQIHKERITVMKSSKLTSPMSKASSTVSSHQYSNRDNLHTPKTTNIRLRIPKVDPTKLHTAKKENRGSDSQGSKMAHANELRSKLLLLKKEKLREDNERKASEVLGEEKVVGRAENETKSSSRRGASLNRTETLAGGQGPNKKNRVHLFPKEDKASVFDTSDVVVLTHSVKKQKTGFTTNLNKMTSHRGVCRGNTTSDYGLDDLNSDNDTDDENKPRKEIPTWAEFSFVKRSVREHIENPPFDLDEFFGKIEKPNLQEIFGKNNQSKARGSSARWN